MSRSKRWPRSRFQPKAYEVIAGNAPDGAQRDKRGLFPLIVERPLLALLKAARGLARLQRRDPAAGEGRGQTAAGRLTGTICRVELSGALNRPPVRARLILAPRSGPPPAPRGVFLRRNQSRRVALILRRAFLPKPGAPLCPAAEQSRGAFYVRRRRSQRRLATRTGSFGIRRLGLILRDEGPDAPANLGLRGRRGCIWETPRATVCKATTVTRSGQFIRSAVAGRAGCLDRRQK